MFAVVSRAMLRNVGDDLIFRRGLAILKHVAPDRPLVEGKAWLPLHESFDAKTLSALDGIVVPGGPGARSGLGRIYPFLDDARARGIPVFFLGVGTNHFPGTPTQAHRPLDGASAELLRSLAERQPIGVRDYLSLELLRHNRVPAQMNGCPAWYALDALDAPVPGVTKLERVAFTTPTQPRYADQCIGLLRSLRRLLPDTSLFVGFHRGIGPGGAMPEQEGRGNLRILEEARRLGCDHADLSGSAENLARYAECDLHVGYRLHAHIYFLSLHKPSLLVAEDARGTGGLHALGGVGRPGWSALAEHDRLCRVAARVRSRLLVASDEEIGLWLELALERERDLGFPHVAAAAGVIRETFEQRMKPFVERMLGGSPG